MSETAGDGLEDALRRGQPAESFEQDRALARLEERLFSKHTPAVLARYELGRELGRGGHSVVYAGFDPDLQRQVAIKLLQVPAYGASSPRAAQRLLREAQALARLVHPNVVAVHDMGAYAEHGGGVFIVMDLVEGMDLDRWLSERPRSVPELLDVFTSAARGLAAAHAADLVHRDFKPANVFVGDDGHVRVGDFGLARPVGEPADGESRIEEQVPIALTASGATVGTPAYMAPEQHAQERADPRSDQYAFCVSLFEALYGRLPFEGDSIAKLAEAKRRGQLEFPSRPVPAWLRRAIQRGLAPAPERRWPSMDSLIAELVRRRARGPRMLVGAALLTSGIGIGVAAGLGVFTGPACTEPDDLLEAAWGSPERAAIEGAFEATGAVGSDEALEAVTQQLDAWAGRWSTAHTTACERAATRSETVAANAEACLDAQLLRFTALVGVLSSADADVVARAAGAAADLPSVDACNDEAWLQLGGDAGLDRERADAEAFYSAGRYEDAAARVEKLSGDAQRRGDDRLAGRVALLAADIEATKNRFEAERDALDRAMRHSERAGDEVTTTRALVRLVICEGNHLGDLPAAWRRAEHARARIERLELGGPIRAQLEHAVGLLHFAAGDFEAATEAYERALVLRESSLPASHTDIAETHLSIGAAQLQARKFDRARHHFERSLELTRALYGPRHPLVGHGLGNLGVLLERQGHYAEALARHREALELHEAAVGERHIWIARSVRNIGRALLHLGQRDRAMDHYQRAARIYTELGKMDYASQTEEELASLLGADEDE